ncbi:MAG: hypothetical protein M1817_001012 [Caeruleum heppii]|nr:MAG: hypothetical protein M1817_001012 [Caeruleum heppii]
MRDMHRCNPIPRCRFNLTVKGPFCQISTVATSLPQGLRDPPAYSPPPSPRPHHATLAHLPEQPPAYAATPPSDPEKIDTTPQAEDVLHFIDPAHDTLASLSLRYGVPVGALRRTNALYSDHLLAARKTILIPGEFYRGGVSLSPRPIEGEEEELRKGKVRRWMVACKVAEYDVALLYLKQSNYDLDLAVETYRADEKWEKEHPMASARGKGKANQDPPTRRLGIGGGIVGQLS